MSSLSEIETTLNKLEAVHAELKAGGYGGVSAEEAGYAAVHVARRATEDAFRELHQKRDLAPGLKESRPLYGLTLAEARRYLREGMAQAPPDDSPQQRALIAVAKLSEALRDSHNDFVLAVKAKEVAVLLLGPHRLGGLYAEWQTSTLGVGLLTWGEQHRLNLRILKKVRELDPDESHHDAEKYELPPAGWIEVGCHINIARSCFRAVADQNTGDPSPEVVLKVGAEALRAIEGYVASDPQQYEDYEIAVLEAMESALRDHLGLYNPKKDFWNHLRKETVAETLERIKASEPYEVLCQIVFESAQKAGVNIREPLLVSASV